MASNATNPRPDRVVRVIHWLFPSRRQVAVSLLADVGLATLRLPRLAHLALMVALHLAVHLVGRLD